MSVKILVIEDEITVLQNTLEILRMEGFEVKGVESGQAGINAVQEYSPDLILCDIMMPGMDGYEVLAELRKIPRTALTPFVFLTARTDRRDVRYGMNLGADDYLTKPFTVAELLQCVHTRLDKSSAIANQAEKKLDTLRQNLLMSMPHELRTPLTSILGFSDLLKMDGRTMPPEQIVQMAELINSAAVRLTRLVENYLTYAQIEIIQRDTDRLSALKNYTTGAADAVIENETDRTVGIFERGADLNIHTERAAVHVSRDVLKKITEELVNNACKFSQPGTPIHVKGMVEGSFYSLRVSDKGRGMKPEQIAQVGAYMQFERATWEQQGSGLGLAIAKRLAELHAGKLRIDSTPGQGTTVTVCLPLA